MWFTDRRSFAQLMWLILGLGWVDKVCWCAGEMRTAVCLKEGSRHVTLACHGKENSSCLLCNSLYWLWQAFQDRKWRFSFANLAMLPSAGVPLNSPFEKEMVLMFKCQGLWICISPISQCLGQFPFYRLEYSIKRKFKKILFLCCSKDNFSIFFLSFLISFANSFLFHPTTSPS